MHLKLLDDWALERAGNMMLLPSDDTRGWLEDFAAWLERNPAAKDARIAELEAELQFFRATFPKAAQNYADEAARAAVGE